MKLPMVVQKKSFVICDIDNHCRRDGGRYTR